MKDISLLSNKPVIYAANLCEDDFVNNIETNRFYQQVCEIAQAENAAVFPICAKIEEEISDMEQEDKDMFLAELNLTESGLDRIIKASYSLLGLISYLTAGPQEVRAWTITKGTKAPQAAGKIHTDFERGFIRAEIVSYDDLMACGSMAAAKEKGIPQEKALTEGESFEMAANIVYAVLRSNGKPVKFDEALSLVPPDTDELTELLEGFQAEYEKYSKKKQAKTSVTPKR